MWGIKSVNLVDYLCSNGIFPEYDRYGVTFFKRSDKFIELLEQYYIKTVCIPNKVGIA